jgi:exopolysaccharide biosynthesis polyprenyl glycosylphosphotransferase
VQTWRHPTRPHRTARQYGSPVTIRRDHRRRTLATSPPPNTEEGRSLIRRYITALRLALAAADGLTAIALFLGLSVVRFGSPGWRETWVNAGIDPFVAAAGYGLALVTALWLQGLYRLRARLSKRREITDVLVAILFLAVVVFTTLYLLKLPDVSRLFLLLLFSFQAVLTLCSRAAIREVFIRLRTRGYNARFMLVVGANPRAEAFANAVAGHVELGLRPIGYLAGPNDPPEAASRLRRPILGRVEDIQDIMHGTVVDEVAICLTIEDWALVEPITRLCEDEGRIVRIPVTEGTLIIPGGHIEDFHGMSILSLVYGPDRILGIAVKRLIDIVVAAVALVLLAPFLLIVAAVIRFRDGPPILFRQSRVGLHGRLFLVTKFRTMVPEAEALLTELEASNEIRGPAFKMTDDPRLSRSGGWLRATSIDELPQLWNVLRGEMSIVGPRPPLPREVEDYDIWHRRRLSMKPGITGLWQVAGRRDPDFDRWVRLDLDYIDHWSLWLDLKIVARTIPAMLAQEGR